MTDLGRFEEITAETPYAGIERRVLTTSKATVQEYRFEPGATFPQLATGVPEAPEGGRQTEPKGRGFVLPRPGERETEVGVIGVEAIEPGCLSGTGQLRFGAKSEVVARRALAYVEAQAK